MEMVVNTKLNTGDVEGEDYDCAALESSLSSLLGFLDPTSNGQTRGTMERVFTSPSGNPVDAPASGRTAGGDPKQPQPSEASTPADQPEPSLEAQSQQQPQRQPSAGGSDAAVNSADNAAGNSQPKSGTEADAREQQDHSATQMAALPTSGAQLFAEDTVVAAVAKRASISSCSSDGAVSSNASNVAPELGVKVADVCRATVRDMLKDVLLETLPFKDAVEVMFKMDSHSGWSNISSSASTLIASSVRLESGAAGAAAAAASAALPPPYRGSASLPATPAKSAPCGVAIPPSLTVPPLLPLHGMSSHVYDVKTAAAAMAAAAVGTPSPPPPPPPPPLLPPSAGLSSPAGSSAIALAPLTPARSAPGALPPPAFGHLPSGVGSPTPAEGAAGLGSGSSTPMASGPGGIAVGVSDAAGAPAGPSSSLLLTLLQQHPNLVDCLQQNPQLLSSILNVSGASGGGGSGGGGGPVEGLVAAAAAAAAAGGSAGMGSPYSEASGGGGAGAFGGMLPGLHPPPLGSPMTSGLRSPPALPSPVSHGAGIWGSPVPTHGSPLPAVGAFGSPQPHGGGGGGGGLEAFHALMGGFGGGGGAAAAGGAAGGLVLQGTDPTAAGYSCKTFEELSPAVRDKIQSVLDSCGPHIRAEHFDAGVRHWLLQLQLLFGELCAVSALHAIETAANLEGVRRMKAFITTRLIDHYEQMVWAQDPQGYAMRKLTPDLIAVLEELVHSDKGLRWTHFDPKVLDTIREIRAPDAVRTRLSKLCAQELNGVQNVPAYLYTLLSKRGKTAKQAAAQKQMQELALRMAAVQGVNMGVGVGGLGLAALGGVGVGGAAGAPYGGGGGGYGGAPGAGAGAGVGMYGGGAGAGMYGTGAGAYGAGSGAYGAGAGGLGQLGGYTGMFGM